MTKRVAWILVSTASILTACGYTLPSVNEADICGNGAPEKEEQCDDGNDVDGDDCDSNCTTPKCGNGIKTAGEECDDGNAKNGDECNALCQVTICADGQMQPGEECDDGNKNTGDSCDSNCTLPRCGNAVQGPNEVCDDGNVDNGDACNSSCTLRNQTSIFIGTVGTAGHADGLGTEAQLSDTSFMLIHKGTMFITGANTVRSVDLASQQVTTIAGLGGTAGYVNNTNGAIARFGLLEGLATDGTTLWVSDRDNHVLRSISLTSPFAVDTVAGLYAAPGTIVTSKDGIGLSAQFDTLRGIHYYGGLVYLLDSNAAILQTFNPATAEVKTVAGFPYDHALVDGIGATARFVSPRLMTSTESGILYITDTDGRSIRAFNTATAELTTVAGSGQCSYVDGIGISAGLSRPRGVATDGQNVYFTEPDTNTIRQIVLDTKQVSTLSGTPMDCAASCMCTVGVGGGYLEDVGRKAQWNNPWDIAFDRGSKALFVSDAGNFVIRRIQ